MTTTTLPIDLTLLEPLLREMVGLVGLQSTMAIVYRWGGVRLWFPDEPKPDSELVQRVGIEHARQLCARFGGDKPTIPKAYAALQAIRNAEIRANPDGLSVPALALRHGLIERRIYQIRGETAPRSGQSGLFD
jgi:hypothetical protein